MTTTIRVSNPQELLALIPYQLGFEPTNSLVVVSLQGPNQRVGLLARCELEDLTGFASRQTAKSLVTHCLSDHANKLVLVFYYDHMEEGPPSGQGEAAGAPEKQALLAAEVYSLVVQEIQNRVELESVWIVGPKSYFSWSAYTRGSCKEHCGAPCTEFCDSTCRFECEFHEPDGQIRLHSVADFESTQVSAHMVLKGLQYRKSRSEVAEIGRALKAQRDKAGASFRRHENRLRNARQRDGVARWEEETLNFWVQILEQSGFQHHSKAGCFGNECRVQQTWEHTWPAVTAAQLGKIASGLQNRRVRDAILLSLTPDGVATARKFLSSELDVCACGPNGAPMCKVCPAPTTDALGEALVNDALATIVSPVRGVPPVGCQAHLVQSVLTAIVAHCRSAINAPAHSLLCLLSWWQGNGAAARRHNEEALKIDEDYHLASLLAGVLDAGLAPGWARRNKA